MQKYLPVYKKKIVQFICTHNNSNKIIKYENKSQNTYNKACKKK